MMKSRRTAPAKPMTMKAPTKQVVKDIRRATRKPHYTCQRQSKSELKGNVKCCRFGSFCLQGGREILVVDLYLKVRLARLGGMMGQSAAAHFGISHARGECQNYFAERLAHTGARYLFGSDILS